MKWKHLREDFLSLCQMEYHALTLHHLRLNDPAQLPYDVRVLMEQLTEWVHVAEAVGPALVTIKERQCLTNALQSLGLVFDGHTTNWGAVGDAALFLRDAAGMAVSS